ncbi:DUF3592 domain-containing protein [Streptomyces sp. NPDC014870]|uniref:DUF3592 domain-containing protein n=1 Tax=Streptomyces sp. NPDC014870 TaxID=3364925 RepID=UPI0036F74FEF
MPPKDLIGMWLVAVLGITGCVLGVLWTWAEIGLRRRGVRIDAEVIGVREHEDGDGDVHFYPILCFTPPGGTPVRGESYARINEYTPPDMISVVYDPRRPEMFSEDRVTGIVGGLLLLALSAPAAGVGLWWLVH